MHLCCNYDFPLFIPLTFAQALRIPQYTAVEPHNCAHIRTHTPSCTTLERKQCFDTALHSHNEFHYASCLTFNKGGEREQGKQAKEEINVRERRRGKKGKTFCDELWNKRRLRKGEGGVEVSKERGGDNRLHDDDARRGKNGKTTDTPWVFPHSLHLSSSFSSVKHKHTRISHYHFNYIVQISTLGGCHRSQLTQNH